MAHSTNKGAQDQLSRFKRLPGRRDNRCFMRERFLGQLRATIILRRHKNHSRAKLHLHWHQIVLAREIKCRLGRNYTG